MNTHHSQTPTIKHFLKHPTREFTSSTVTSRDSSFDIVVTPNPSSSIPHGTCCVFDVITVRTAEIASTQNVHFIVKVRDRYTHSTPFRHRDPFTTLIPIAATLFGPIQTPVFRMSNPSIRASIADSIRRPHRNERTISNPYETEEI